MDSGAAAYRQPEIFHNNIQIYSLLQKARADVILPRNVGKGKKCSLGFQELL
jgi:hypothetical protein